MISRVAAANELGPGDEAEDAMYEGTRSHRRSAVAMDCYTLEHWVRDRDAEAKEIARTGALLREREAPRPPADGLGVRLCRRGKALVVHWLARTLTAARGTF